MHLSVRFATAVFGIGMVAVALAGCTSFAPTSTHMATKVHSLTSSPPTPSQAPSASTPTPTPLAAIVDSGPRIGAEGKATPLANGELRYVIQSGDNGGTVCDRFGRSSWQGFIADANGKPAGGTTYCGVYSYPGDVMILDRDTEAQAQQRAAG